MKFQSLVLAFAATSSLVQASPLQRRDEVQDLQDKATAALKEAEQNSSTARKSCTLFNAGVRQDWAKMSTADRKSYIKAVQCLIDSPSKSDPALVPGAKNRYDDFVAQHINQTVTVHGTGNFLSWHRLFVHSYEKALRDECGYKGRQPYWNWFANQDDMRKSPVFDGSATSLGGDGAFVQHNGSVGGAGQIWLPSGNGGGCINSGPFKNMIANLGPVSPTQAGETKVSTPLQHNPRCVKRDLSTFTAQNHLLVSSLLNITLGPASKNIVTFQDELQGGPSRFAAGYLGLHAAGHFTIGGDAGDFFSSPVDPAFFLHHTMLDRVWWIWQALHLEQAFTVGGTITLFNNPPSRETSPLDLIGMNYLDVESLPIKDVLNTLGGSPLCYVYV